MGKITKALSILTPSGLKNLLIHAYIHANPEQFSRTKLLDEIIKIRNYSSVLEVGVWDAKNLLKIADSNTSCNFYGVDPYSHIVYGDNRKSDNKQELLEKNAENIYKEVCQKVNQRNNIRIIRKESLQAAKEFKNKSLDLVFIDALHTYEGCKSDIEAWLPKVKSGGLLCGHDYSLTFFGVIRAVNETLGVDKISIKTDSTWFYEVN